MEGQSGTSENPLGDGELVEVELEEIPPEGQQFEVVVVEEEGPIRPRPSFPPGAPRVGTNYNWPGLLKKAAPGYKSLPGFKQHEIQVARDLEKERDSKNKEEDLHGVEASELNPQDSQTSSSSSSCGSPENLGKASIPKSSVPVLLPTPKPCGSARPKSPIGPPPKKRGL